MSPPSAFGTYRVLHQIGSGVLGPVFRAYDSHHDRLVAIKTFKLDLVPEDAARLADQLLALAAKLPAHPAIVGAVEAGLQGSVPYIALEYASGESLDVVLRQTGASPLARALPVLREIARAIDASWAVPVGHGALHPRDIYVTAGTTDVRITGFGIGQALEAMGAKAPVRRPYSAPERATGTAWDARADVYSFGAITYEMLFGQQPRGTDDDDDPVRHALALATADDPADRYETAKDFIDALVEAADRSIESPAAAGDAPIAPARPARIKRPRPITLALPLFEPVQTIGPVAPVSPVPRVEPVVPVSPIPRMEPAAPPPAPTPVLARVPIKADPPPPVELAPDPASFPWVAMFAVLAAGLVIGAIAAYQTGWYQGNRAGRALVAQSTPGDVIETSPPPTPTPEPSPPVASATPQGRLVIQSVPSGALVLVDGRRAGETPVTLSVPFGRHEIQVARPGYEPKTQTVDVTAQSASRPLRVQLRRGAGATVPAAQGTGAVDVDSRPRGARVTVDGRFVGVTPLRVPELKAGDHRVRIELADHQTVTPTVNIVGGAVAKLQVTLRPGELKMLEVRRIVR